MFNFKPLLTLISTGNAIQVALIINDLALSISNNVSIFYSKYQDNTVIYWALTDQTGQFNSPYHIYKYYAITTP